MEGPLWTPPPDVVANANVTAVMSELGFDDYRSFHAWTAGERAAFWGDAVQRLGIVFDVPPDTILDISRGVEQPRWLAGARLNIAQSCFTADPQRTAVVYAEGGEIRNVGYGELQAQAAAVAAGLKRIGIGVGDPVAIAMSMNAESVAAYLGIVAAGGVVVSIADSFASAEIATRLRIANTGTVITQDVIRRGGKILPMYEKVVEAGAGRCIVIGDSVSLRPDDHAWDDFLDVGAPWQPEIMPPDAPTNILFSSGTTGDPKAIPWDQTSPIKCAVDGYYHQDVHSTDVIAWPTNLGWMMGPWLIYAPLINNASLALYDDLPTGRGFVEFVRDAGVTILGVVPSLVAGWRARGVLGGVDWSRIRVFSSTGEASNEADMEWLMAAAGGKPVIEYCGGTEVSGAYISGTVVQTQLAAAFSTPTVGLDLEILDEEGNAATAGEVFLVPPSIGMSNVLLNRDHHEVYYAEVPRPGLRRHGDHMERLQGGYIRAHGRADDTMNLSGIKVGSAEIERVLLDVAGVAETAAIAVEPPGGGPSRLVIYAVPHPGVEPDVKGWLVDMQRAVSTGLNPLFKIADVVAINELPRTASAKVMRRKLRAAYG